MEMAKADLGEGGRGGDRPSTAVVVTLKPDTTVESIENPLWL